VTTPAGIQGVSIVPAAWLLMLGLQRVRVQGNHGELIANRAPRHPADEGN